MFCSLAPGEASGSSFCRLAPVKQCRQYPHIAGCAQHRALGAQRSFWLPSLTPQCAGYVVVQVSDVRIPNKLQPLMSK